MIETKPKQNQMQDVLEALKTDQVAETITARRKGVMTDLGLVNHYKLHDIIPNKWFDWERRVDAPVMFIGQDWGPYEFLKKYVNEYETEKLRPDFNYDDFLFKTFSSRTEKFIINAIESSYQEVIGDEMPKNVWDKFVFTMAVLFTRQGVHFRGNHNFDPKQSAEVSYPYVAKQLEIIKPKVIMLHGNMALDVVRRYFGREDLPSSTAKLLDQMGKSKYLDLDGTVVIPNYHPAAHVDPKIIRERFNLIWELV